MLRSENDENGTENVKIEDDVMDSSSFAPWSRPGDVIVTFDPDKEPPPKKVKKVNFADVNASLKYWEKINQNPWISSTVEQCIVNNTLGETISHPQFCAFIDGKDRVDEDFVYSVTDGRTRIYFQTSSNISESVKSLHDQEKKDCDETGWVIYLQEYKISTQILPEKNQATFVIQTDDYVLLEFDELVYNMIYKRLKWLRWCEFQSRITNLMKTRLKLDITVPPNQRYDWKDVLLMGTPWRKRKNHKLSRKPRHANSDINLPGPSTRFNDESNFHVDVRVDNFCDDSASFTDDAGNIILQLKNNENSETFTKAVGFFSDEDTREVVSPDIVGNKSTGNRKSTIIDQTDIDFSPVITSTATKQSGIDRISDLQSCTIFDDVESDSCDKFIPVSELPPPACESEINFVEDSVAEQINNYIEEMHEEINFNKDQEMDVTEDSTNSSEVPAPGENVDRKNIYELLKSPRNVAQLITPLDDDRVPASSSSESVRIKIEPEDSIVENRNTQETEDNFTPLAVFVDPSKEGSAQVSILDLPARPNVADEVGEVYFQCTLNHDATNKMCELISNMRTTSHSDARESFINFLSRTVSECVKQTSLV